MPLPWDKLSYHERGQISLSPSHIRSTFFIHDFPVDNIKQQKSTIYLISVMVCPNLISTRRNFGHGVTQIKIRQACEKRCIGNFSLSNNITLGTFLELIHVRDVPTHWKCQPCTSGLICYEGGMVFTCSILFCEFLL